jgi:TRAP-type C4-dicarboxylate transport system permease small subunit
MRKFFSRLDEWLILSMLALMGVVLAIQVFMRYVLNSPLIWSEELARYLFVWLTFMGAGYGVKHNIHIKMEYFYNHMHPILQKMVKVLTNCLSIACYTFIIYYGVNFTTSQRGITSSAMGIDMSLVFAALPIGCALLVLNLITDTIRIFKSEKMVKSETDVKGGI